VDLLVLIELFLLGVMAEALWVKIDRKSEGGSVSAKFSRSGTSHTNHFCT